MRSSSLLLFDKKGKNSGNEIIGLVNFRIHVALKFLSQFFDVVNTGETRFEVRLGQKCIFEQFKT